MNDFVRAARRFGRAAGLVFLLLALAAPAARAAAANVRWQGDAGRFVEVEGDDLFADFKGVMPGDTLTQTIRLQNLPSSGAVAVYLRAETPDAADARFLSRLTLTVRQGDTILTQAGADQLGGLSQDVLLGRFNAAFGTDLTATLAVPDGLGNEFADFAGAVRWVFTVQEQDAPAAPAPSAVPAAPSAAPSAARRAPVPQTGDPLPAPFLPAAGAVGALAGFLALTIAAPRRRRPQKDPAPRCGNPRK